MTREDASYFLILLKNGFHDEYDEWLDRHLEEEDPLSDLVLDLSLCASDVNETISCLQNYCADLPAGELDESAVCERLRLFLKEAHHANRLSKEQTVDYMFRFALSHGDPGDFGEGSWNEMYFMGDNYCLAQEGYNSWESFDSIFYSYLDQGIPFVTRLESPCQNEAPKSLLRKLLERFRKK